MPKNTDLLDGAVAIHMDTTSKLKGALADLQHAKTIGVATADTLDQTPTKIATISSGMTVVESELDMSQRRLTHVIKRLATDKIVILFCLLISIGIIAVVVYQFKVGF
jgi:hypothetical protein